MSPKLNQQAIQTPIRNQSTLPNGLDLGLPKRPDIGPDREHDQTQVNQGLTIKGRAGEISKPKSAVTTNVNSKPDKQAFQPQSLAVETQKVIETSEPKSASGEINFIHEFVYPYAN